ncbi:MAG: acyloxyacyl hydrolase [Bacteroidetes bacterium]|nr:acyloxyacyl hydrolase [Bacteroidota bacterium]
MKIKCFTVLFLILFSVSLSAQETLQSGFQIPSDNKNYGSFAFVEGVYHYSHYLENSDKLANIMKNRANTFEFKVGLQTNGEKAWEQYWGYPSYGIGFYSASFGPADTLGEPSALYVFYGGPIKRGNKLGFFYEMGVGVSYDFVKFDPITNPEQDIIGSTVNVYLAVKFYMQYQLSKRLDASLGLDLAHFSNGNTRTPNMGLNIYGPNIGLRYNFNPMRNYTRKIDPNYRPPLRPEFIKHDHPAFEKSNFLHIFLAGAGKTTKKQIYDGPTYFAGTVALDYTRQYSHIARWGTGFDFFYDSSLREDYEDTRNVPFKDLMHLGVHVGNELLITRIHFITQFGYYLYNRAYKGSWYMRFNLRVLITDSFGIQGGLKTLNGGAADFIEWGIYYRLMKK